MTNWILGIVLSAVVLLSSTWAAADEVTAAERFDLWNNCRPVVLVVEEVDDKAAAIGLTAEAISVAVRSRLRAARLYTEDNVQARQSLLHVEMRVAGDAFRMGVAYAKMVTDHATKLTDRTATWRWGATGTHAQRPDIIVTAASQGADRFIDEYLRVNESACR